VATQKAREFGVTIEHLTLDVTETDAPDHIVRHAIDRFGRVDAAVNCAGVEGGTLPLDRCTDEDFDHVMNVNLRGVFRCLRAELRQMYLQGSGSIVNVSSASVFGVHPDLGPYTTSKAGVLTLTRVAAKEAGPRGVRVNAVCPGLTNTPMLQMSREERSSTEDIARRIPLGRVGTPEEQAEAILWLCSDRSSFVNGTGLVSDGGRVG
jgi:NAD(P)-dependent dehydrogenase (short-subunit alcohol dehydrogenase family)